MSLKHPALVLLFLHQAGHFEFYNIGLLHLEVL
jgi:hypothetical protein